MNLDSYRGFELVTREFELVTRGFELVTRGFELVTRVLLFHFYDDLKYKILKFLNFNISRTKRAFKGTLMQI